MFLYAAAIRTGRLWAPLPHPVGHESPRRRWARYAVGAWYAAVLAAAAVGLIAGLRALKAAEWETGPPDAPGKCPSIPCYSIFTSRAWLWGLLQVVCFMVVHAFYWTNMRMRAPLMPVVALAAAGGFAWIAGRTFCRKS
jgi:hypothetical protein